MRCQLSKHDRNISHTHKCDACDEITIVWSFVLLPETIAIAVGDESRASERPALEAIWNRQAAEQASLTSCVCQSVGAPAFRGIPFKDTILDVANKRRSGPRGAESCTISQENEKTVRVG